MTTAKAARPVTDALARRAGGLVGSVIDSSTTLLARQTHDIVRFAMGAPSDDLIPVDLLDAYAAQHVPGKYAYGSSEGETVLAEQILERFAPHTEEPERITITTGGMQGLDLACKLFVDPGDLVIVEGPTYTNGSATALSYGAQVVEVPVDSDGMRVDLLADAVQRSGRPPKVIYTIPNFQNPSGVTLSVERRLRLLELAERWGSVVLDDDPYGVLRFAEHTLPSFHELSPDNPLVFSVRTFSKIIAPGLRLGWVDADPALRTILINAKQAMDTRTAVPTQIAVAAFLRDGRFEPHRDRVLGLYRQRKDAMRSAFADHFGETVQTTDPEGGFFLWATFADGAVNTEQLFEPALAGGVVYIPGPAFSVEGHFSNALRLCFATSTPDRIDEGVRRLKAVVDASAGALR